MGKATNRAFSVGFLCPVEEYLVLPDRSAQDAAVLITVEIILNSETSRQSSRMVGEQSGGP
jgi:hypothetical protein